ncbi:uncharacterized protein NH340_JMT06796 [Sarcoptes scabiei]|nr:uncharacterized protein NH340_JMT06796 [Sarcoptes scabiei]
MILFAFDFNRLRSSSSSSLSASILLSTLVAILTENQSRAFKRDSDNNFPNGNSLETYRKVFKATCGYPGSPRNGRVLNLLERYEEGMVVTFECDPEHFLLGPMTRTCLNNGTWSNQMPVCDQSVKNLGLTSASEALNNYPPQLAIDGNFRTCFFSNRRKPRWWRVELPSNSLKNQSIVSVALTLPPINAELFFSIYIIEVETLSSQEYDQTNKSVSESLTISTSSKYHKCATFRGVFSSKTIFVHCSSSNLGEKLQGHYLQIEDEHPQLEYFGLCEVDLFVKRDRYECGQVEIPAHGSVIENQITIDGIRSVRYYCQEGFRLIGESERHCDSKTGQWSHQEPFCERITCPEPTPLENAFYRIYGDYYDLPVMGTKTVYECRPGYVFDGLENDTSVCGNNGQWSNNPASCEPIDCGHPESMLINSEEFFLSGARFELINDTTTFMSIAEVICSPESNGQKNSIKFRCREDGRWMEVQTSSTSTENTNSFANNCIKSRHNGFLLFTTIGSKNIFRKNFLFKETSINVLHLLAAVVIAAFVSIFIIVVLLFKRNIIEWPSMDYFQSFINFLKQIGQSFYDFVIRIFVIIKSFSQSLNCSPSLLPVTSNSREKTSSFLNDSPIESELITQSSQIISSNNSSQQTNEKNTKETNNEELESALATFYEEITNAAKRMFSEETDRKLLRAARIAAELEAIKNYPEQSSNYQWVYSTPPRFATSTSLPPSLHEYHQIPSSNQIYAKVDLIRKHRYRKGKEISVYQVPKPRCLEENCTLRRNNHFPSDCCLSTETHRLRKAISTPDEFVDAGEYATLRKLMNTKQSNGGLIEISNQNSNPHFDEPINRFPLRTLL